MTKHQVNKKKKLFFFYLIMFLTAQQTIGQELKIGVISDYKEGHHQLTKFRNDLFSEVSKTIGASTTLSIKTNDVIATNWNTNKVKVSYQILTQRCDIIILVGPLSTQTVLRNNTINKPTLSIGISNTAIQKIPITEESTSGIHNFSYILSTRNIIEELEQFYELLPFKNLAVLIYEKTRFTMDQKNLQKRLLSISEKFNCNIQTIYVSEDIQNSLQAINSEIDAVFVGLSYELEEIKIKEISDYLISKSLPSYSPLRTHTSLGLLSSLASDNSYQSTLRKLAIMVDDINRGTPAEDLTVTLGSKKQLYFNANTSKKINFSPSFHTLFTANIINQDTQEVQNSYSLNDILEKSLKTNLKVQISQKDIELAVQNLQEARSNYLPTISTALQGVQINENATNQFLGQSERTMTLSTGVEQLIYSEPLIANIRIQKYLKEAQKHATKLEINNTIFETYQKYLNVLLTKSNVTVQRENLAVSKKNLEIAQIRSTIGAANKSDVYRWQSEVANATQTLIQAQTDLILAKYGLNAFLNNSLGEYFEIEDIGIDNTLFSFYKQNPFPFEIKTPYDLNKATRLFTAYALKNYPSIKQIDNTLNALERQQKMNQRAYYLPSLSIGVNQSEILERSGLASEPTPISNFIDSRWNIGISLTYSIFDGNRKNIALKKTLIEKNQLALQKNDLTNNISLNVQNSTAKLVTAKANINFSKISADNAWKNFEIIQDFYRQGSVSIVQLFDAQNAALQAKLRYFNSIYNYVLAFVSLENSIGYFNMLATPQERSEFEKILQSYHSN